MQSPTVGDVRNAERAASVQYNQNGVWLPNPNAAAPFDRHGPQTYEQKVYGLGLAPNIPQHFWQLIKGDAGASSSIYRVTELFQRLAPTNERTAETPYSKAIAVATMASSDQRSRYFHATLFSIGRVFGAAAPTPPLASDQISRFAPGIPAGTPSVSGNTQFAVPQFSTTKFRIMVFDESGQRFVDVDVLGVRSMNVYGFGATVFALIKEDGYEIDRARDDNPALGPGLLDQSIVGARIVPIRSNKTQNINNRTVTIQSPGSLVGIPPPTVVPIPPGTRTVQGYATSVFAVTTRVFFATIDPLDSAFPVISSQGGVDFVATVGGGRTDITDVPNANAIVISDPVIGAPSVDWVFVFEVG